MVETKRFQGIVVIVESIRRTSNMIKMSEALERLDTARMAVMFGLPLDWVIENILRG